jgi:nucleotide-binding universal stress UspA family protein
VYRKILVGSDGSPTAHKAVDRAAALAEATGAELTVLTVGTADRAGAVVEAEAKRISEANPNVALRTKTESGDPSHVILDEAEAGGYDLLVVGNKGMTGASRFFLGSVPNKVSHHAPCALLIVRTT